MVSMGWRSAILLVGCRRRYLGLARRSTVVFARFVLTVHNEEAGLGAPNVPGASPLFGNKST